MSGSADQVAEAGIDFVDLVVLSVVQGVTEFIPISSSGHLILASKALGTDRSVADGTIIDVALHVGSLIAIFIYFWRDARDVVLGPFTLYSDVRNGRELRWSSKLFLLLSVATIPLVIFGLALVLTGYDVVFRDESSLFIIKLIGWTTLLYGIALYLADRYAPAERQAESWNWRDAVILGLSQALALIPGTSRSGITMTVARVLGFDRREGSRIALLMAIPAILAPSFLSIYDLAKEAKLELTGDALIGAAISFATAYLTLFLMMRWLKQQTFTPFVIYRVILGVVLLGLAYGGLWENGAPLPDPSIEEQADRAIE